MYQVGDNLLYILLDFTVNDIKDRMTDDKGTPGGSDSGSDKETEKVCKVSSNVFMLYYWILMFLLCFATPVLVTSSLNVFIYSAVKNTTYEVHPISNNISSFTKISNVYLRNRKYAGNYKMINVLKLLKLTITGGWTSSMVNAFCLRVYVGSLFN